MTEGALTCFMAAGVAAGSVVGLSATELTVGPGKMYSLIEDAAAIAKSGDIVLVHPQPDNSPYLKTHIVISQPQITIKAITQNGVCIRLSGNGFDYGGQGSVPRAIVQFNKGADACVFEGFELSGARNNSHNGAGIRINQANKVTIRGCVIHGNDMGIMSNGDGTPQTAADQLIENCLIHSNGDNADPGYNHNLYLGGASVTLRGCEVHSSLTGHNIKSRAHRTTVLGCYVHDSANRELDLVDDKAYTTTPGSDAVLAGNVIVKAANCIGNRNVIHFGQDGGNEHDGTLHLFHNTIVTSFVAPVVQLSAAKARTQLYNNLLWDGGSGQNNQVLLATGKDSVKAQVVTGTCNWLSSGFRNADLESLPLQQTFFGDHRTNLPFADPCKGDFRLSENDPTIVDRGCILPANMLQALGGRLTQYRHPQSTESRPDDAKPDLGAYESPTR